MRISDWSSDVCSSDLRAEDGLPVGAAVGAVADDHRVAQAVAVALVRPAGPAKIGGIDGGQLVAGVGADHHRVGAVGVAAVADDHLIVLRGVRLPGAGQADRSEEHTSELQSLMRISYAVFCLKKKNDRHVYHIG